MQNYAAYPLHDRLSEAQLTHLNISIHLTKYIHQRLEGENMT